MRASTRIDVRVGPTGRSVLHAVHCEAPLLVRSGDAVNGLLHLWLVGGAAGPLGGDELQLELRVGDGASVVVRSVAAQLVQPGPSGLASSLAVHADVGDGATLDWDPEPTVSVAGSVHRTTTLLRVHQAARVRWTDRVALGRDGEPPGRLVLHQRVERAGRVVLDHCVEFADGALRGPGAHGPARHAVTTVVLGPEAPSEPAATVSATASPTALRAVLPIARCAALVTSSTD